MRWALLLSASLLLGASCGGTGDVTPGPAPSFVNVSVRLRQYDVVRFGGFSQPDTSYGGALVTFEGAEGIHFLNLAVEAGGVENWHVKDVPIIAGCGGRQEVHLTIDLGSYQVALGTQDVRGASYACTLSTLPLASKPREFRTTAVETATVRLESGFTAGVLSAPGPLAPRPVLATRTMEFEADFGCHTAFPNQESGVGECVPVAVSNSLKFLGAGAGANDIDQGVPGGRIIEVFLYDPVENGFVGGLPIIWDMHYQFTIEAP